MSYTTALPRLAGADWSARADRARSFLERRILRVVPLYWLALLWHRKRDLLSGKWDADMLRDFAFVPHFNPGHGGRIFPELVQGWSLNAEMFFYSIFAICMTAFRSNLLAACTMICALGVLGAAVGFDSAAARFYTSPWLFEFALGIGLYALWSRGRLAAPTWLLIALLPLGFGLLALDAGMAVRAVASAAIVWSAIVLGERTTLRSTPLRLLGDASYAIYLFHVSTFGVAVRAIKVLQLDGLPVAIGAPAIIAMHVIVASLIGVALHFTVEKPLLEFSRRLLARRRAGNAVSASA
jgi:exopolysaccharide production protein ExoZ